MDYHIPVIAGQSEGGLPFEVKVFLPAKVNLALQSMDRVVHGALGRVFCIDPRPIFKAAFGGQSLLYCQYGRFSFDLNHGQTRGAAGQMMALGHHQKDWLASIMHLAIREKWLVMGGGGDVIGMGKILGLQHQMYSWAGAHGTQIH